jgi:hypothetical protein
MAVLEAPHFEETRKRLMADPIVIAMAEELPAEIIKDACHDSGSPRSDFMLASLREYEKRAGHGAESHIGGVAEAIIRLRLA